MVRVEWQGKKGFAIATALDRSGRVPGRAPQHAVRAGCGHRCRRRRLRPGQSAQVYVAPSRTIRLRAGITAGAGYGYGYRRGYRRWLSQVRIVRTIITASPASPRVPRAAAGQRARLSDRPVHVIVPFTAARADVLNGLLGQKLAENGPGVVIENRAAATR